ncbi:hypothetical protein SAMN05444279_13122 [Ruegeria intermedia]|uniref:Uncharacterized protein n=1 Tax=Ruegeria intermedia TaxID=996115 RepID=A0A1M5B3F1_9RHOB|nr:hypothetical protein [Ruegeria intermedia]SHF36712.1 hypothetical protein SAMN05444279_13122 [Ruegeria intermedia]
MKKALAPILLFPTATVAHEGHGAASEAHWLTQPDHLTVILLGALVILPLVFRVAGLVVHLARTWEKIHE